MTEPHCAFTRLGIMNSHCCEALIKLGIRTTRQSWQLIAFSQANGSVARTTHLRKAQIFAKTCCTISTISYNYQQVTSVFARFMSDVSTRRC